MHLIWLVLAATALLFWLDRRGARRLDRFVSALMQQRLVARPVTWRRVATISLLGLAGVALVLALMRPQSGLRSVTTPRVGAQIMICLDVSRSMLAEDVAPSRLGRAKVEIQDLLGLIDRDHVGLIAFAGKATVLSPMTPDFGFLRLVLESTGPASVALGGTNLEAPIRMAVDGFRGQSDLSRAIILITDGEDHESYAMEAAQYASERGIRIIAIGFGDEQGSEIMVTDPGTGARASVTDADGRPVVSRLDGDLLRRVALETGGVYIPAGTGALDLDAIYMEHIGPLVRGRLDGGTRMIRQERFQWPLLAALICLFASAAVVQRPTARAAAPARAATVSAVTAAVLLSAITPATAQTGGGAPALAPAAQAAQEADDPPASQASGMGEADEIEADEIEEDEGADPRELYNGGLAMLASGELDDAERQFRRSRRRAGSDGLARYRATYNLGIVACRRYQQISEPSAEALAHLHEAADWFREAVRLQSDEPAPRENLEIVSRWALALADTLSREQDGDLTARLDQLIDGQRQLVQLLKKTVEQVDESEVPEHLRERFAGLEVEQRMVLSDLEAVADDARSRAEQIDQVPEDERKPEQSIELAKLAGVGAYLYQSSQRMGQTRRHLRRRQADRAYRRAAAALGELKRARDQMRDLVEALAAVIDDAMRLTRHVGQLAGDRGPIVGGADEARDALPKWLTREYLQDQTATVKGRTDELAARVEAGIAHIGDNDDEKQDAAAGPAPGPAGDPDQADDEASKALLELLREAAPEMRKAQAGFGDLSEALASQRDQEAYRAGADATVALIEARELFLDPKGLVELMYATQNKMKQMLAGAGDDDLRALVPVLVAGQLKNDTRAARMDGLLDRALKRLDAPESAAAVSGAAGGAAAPSDAEKQRQRFETARTLLGEVRATFESIGAELPDVEPDATAPVDLRRDALKAHVDTSVTQIEALRRLFFSILEHLRDTAQRQMALADETRDASAMVEPDALSQAMGPLAERQRGLRHLADQIAESLLEQSQMAPAPSQAAPTDPAAAEKSAAMAQQMQQASGIVTEAGQAMGEAAMAMTADPVDGDVAGTQQQLAVEKLSEALRLLSPPQDQPESQQDPSKGQGSEGDGQQGDQPPQAQRQQGRMDMDRLLQSVRDRAAQRERARRRGDPARYARPEKDW
ncbi:MAG: hypothetical protein CMJ18_11780 [Phycisphaeraceae bacterium]|nr:hypothetical protein [Phycisphaeraceae bacterium]